MFFCRIQDRRSRALPALFFLAAFALGPALSAERRADLHFATDADSRSTAPGLSVGLERAAPKAEWSSPGNPQALAFAKEAFQKLAVTWKLPLDRRAARTLRFELRELELDEHAESVGATYSASVTLSLSFHGEDERILWKGRAKGSSSRFGRAGHPRIAHLTLSDAFTEALAALVEQDALQEAWLSEDSPRRAPVVEIRREEPPADPNRAKERSPDLDRITPEALRDDLVALMKAGFNEAHLLDVVDTKALARSFDEKDVASWRAAGIPEAVLRAARVRPVL